MRAFFLALLLTSAVPALAGEPTVSEWETRFTAPALTGEIPTDKFARLIELMGSRPETARLLDEVLDALEFSSPEELRKLIAFCNDLPASQGGTTQFLAFDSLSYGVDQTAPIPVWKDHSEQIGKYHRVDQHSLPTICMRAGKSLSDTFETFVHELTHILEMDSRLGHEFDPLQYQDLEDFLRASVIQRGGEYEAYAMEARVMHPIRDRVLKELKGGGYHVVLNLVDTATHEIRDPLELELMILNRWGYRNNFAMELINQQSAARREYEMLASLIPGVDRNIKVAQGNVTQLEQFLAKSPTHPSAAEYRARLQKNRDDEARLKKELEAIRADASEAKWRSEELLRRFPEAFAGLVEENGKLVFKGVPEVDPVSYQKRFGH